MNKELQEFKDIAFEIAREENLYCLDSQPMNILIDYRSPVFGTLKRYGTLYIRKKNRQFQILIYTTQAQFFKHQEGRYISKNNDKKYTRGIGKNRTLSDIRDTICHELAHIKYLRHGKLHSQYTKELVKKFDTKIQYNNPVIAMRITQENTQYQRDS